MVDHKNGFPEEDTEIEEIELSEELSELETSTPFDDDSDDEKEEGVGGLFGYNLFTKKNLFYLALLALAIVAIICLCKGNSQYGCESVNSYVPEWAADMLETSSLGVENNNLSVSDTSE